MSTEYTYDFQNQKRDLSDVVSTVVQGIPALINTISFSGVATNTKYEWLNDVFKAQGGVTAEALDDSETGLDVATGTGANFSARMIINFSGYSEVMLVTGVTGDTLTVTRGYGGTTAEAIATATPIRILSRPEPESSVAGQDDSWNPTVDYNYSQIWRATARVSGTTLATAQYGVENELNRQVANHLRHLLWSLNRSLIYGRRIERTSSVLGSMGGLLQFIGQAGANKITPTPVSPATSVAVTATIINDALEAAILSGGRPTVILCNTNQARRISAFNDAKLVVQNGSTTVGNSISTFVSDLPIGQLSQVVVDTDFPKDQIAIIDPTKINVVPFSGRAFNDFDATPPGADYVARTIIGEYTAAFYSAKEAHCLITGLQA